MRNILILFLIGASACAASAPKTTIPVQYACRDTSVTRDPSGLRINDDVTKSTKLGWSDATGDHYVMWPVSPTDVEAVEFVVPNDPRLDATERFYDTSKGASIADWRVVKRDVCTAHGGYTDALGRFINGATVADLANDLTHGDRDQARNLVHDALLTLQRRYWKDR